MKKQLNRVTGRSFVMKNVLLFLSVAGVFLNLGCGASPDVRQTTVSSRADVLVEQATPGGVPVNPFYTGDGGKGTSITILEPATRGLGEDQNHLPALVQGEFMSNFSGYSGISVFDRMNLQKIYDEQLLPHYDDNDRAGLDFGHLTSTDYIMNGSITRTATGYALQIQVTESEGKMIAATYSGTCTFPELDNLTGVRRASRDLLEKLGVALTEKAKSELDGAAEEQAVNAQVALSKGIEALRKGTVVEALSYFVQSQSYDPQLTEAASRVNIVSANISSGNIGADARNDIVWRRAWLERLTECEQWVTNYVRDTPAPTFLTYTTELKQEDINYSKETLTISIEEIALRVDDRYDWAAPILGVVNPVYTGLRATERASAWEVGYWPTTSVSRGLSALGNKIPEYETVIELANDTGEIIGRQRVRLRAGWQTGFRNGEATASRSATTTGVRFTGVDVNKITDRLSIRIASLNGEAAETAAEANSVSIMTRDEYGRIIGQRDLAFYRGDDDRALEDYTEAIRLVGAANAYYNRGLVYYSRNDFRHAEEDLAQALRLGLNGANAANAGELGGKAHLVQNCEFRDGVLAKYTGSSKDIVIPESINGIPVTAIEDRAFVYYSRSSSDYNYDVVDARGMNISRVFVPDTVTSIGFQAFMNGFQRGFFQVENYTTGFAISLPANIVFKSEPGRSYVEPLAKFYNGNGKKAGTYTWDGKTWRYEATR
jgi:tetratricopeptide (TPR) repeat protein